MGNVNRITVSVAYKQPFRKGFSWKFSKGEDAKKEVKYKSGIC